MGRIVEIEPCSTILMEGWDTAAFPSDKILSHISFHHAMSAQLPTHLTTLSTLSVKKCFLISNLNLLCHNWRPFLLILSFLGEETVPHPATIFFWGVRRSSLSLLFSRVNTSSSLRAHSQASHKFLGEFVPGMCCVQDSAGQNHGAPLQSSLCSQTPDPVQPSWHRSSPSPTALLTSGFNAQIPTSALAGIILCHVHRDQTGFISR